MSFTLLISQIVIAVAVVAIYHVWVGLKKSAAPPQPLVVPPVAPVASVIAPSAPPKPQAVAPVEAPPSPEILAVIAAAIAAVLDRPHRVVAIQQAAPLAPEGNAWAMEGRVEHFLSHRIR